MKFVPVTAQDLYFSPTSNLNYSQTQCGLLLRSRDCGTHVCVEEYSLAAYEKRDHFNAFLCTYKQDCPQQNGEGSMNSGDVFIIVFLPDVNGEAKTGCVLHSVDGSFSEVPRYKMNKA